MLEESSYDTEALTGGGISGDATRAGREPRAARQTGRLDFVPIMFDEHLNIDYTNIKPFIQFVLLVTCLYHLIVSIQRLSLYMW